MPDPARWGPENPHPLFGRKTELVWDGKYDEYGARRPVDIAGSAMPMQKIETVDMNSGHIAQLIGQLSLKAGDSRDQEKGLAAILEVIVRRLKCT